MTSHAPAVVLFLTLLGCTPSEPAAPAEAPEFMVHGPLLAQDPDPLGGSLSLESANASAADWDLIISEEVTLQRKEETFKAELERSVRVQGIEDATGRTVFTLSEARVMAMPSNASWINQHSTLLNGMRITMRRSPDAVDMELPDDLAPAIAPHVRSIGLVLQLMMPPALQGEVNPDSSWTVNTVAPANTQRMIRPLGTTPCGDASCLVLGSALALAETVDSSNDSAQINAKGSGRGQSITQINVANGVPVSARMDYTLITDMTTLGENVQASTLRQHKKVSVTLRDHEDKSP